MIRSIELGHDHGFVALLLIPLLNLTHTTWGLTSDDLYAGAHRATEDLTEQSGVRRQPSRPCRDKACRHRHGNRSRRPTMPVHPLDAGNWTHTETFLTEYNTEVWARKIPSMLAWMGAGRSPL